MLFSILSIILFGQPNYQDKISFKTHSGDIITVYWQTIYLNKKAISEPITDIIFESKYNRIIEENGSILLFLEIDGSPNFNRIKGFKISKTKATQILDSVYNDKKQRNGPAPFTDIDNDGKLEIGGFDMNEVYPSKDSMYYSPSEYYEIAHGSVVFDSSLTRKMDIKENGIYMKNPLDNDGNCCKVIKKPGRLAKIRN